ncbi:MAG TPA: 30S ribosomal protein S17 [Candidatus Polarisedimenticolia bacterium]|jgi:small subunit ribosomal protein S17|nr:30S ribosomal protein S17 [Candidatus Polarisedimenticolia bacterium]
MPEPRPAAEPAPHRGRRLLLEGVVVSDKMTKTIVVQVERVVRNERYGKYLKRSARFMAHDEKGQGKVGDRVTIVADRPRSARKRWSLRSVITRAERV